MAERTAPVFYRGGSADGVFIESTPEVFFTHGQRELTGTDPDARVEMYRNAGEQTVTLTDPPAVEGEASTTRQVKAWVFEFDGAAASPRLDDEMNPLPPGDTAGPAAP